MLLVSGCVTIDGAEVTDPAYRVRSGQAICLYLPEPLEDTPCPQDINLDILFEDRDVIDIHNPAGLVVHPAAGHHDGTLVNALLHHCRGQLSGIGGVCRPGIVHRLDKETSGLMVVAKTDQAHQSLARQFADHTTVRTYYAIVRGFLPLVPVILLGTLGAVHIIDKRWPFNGRGRVLSHTIRL